jgi:hypothetical protein
MASVSEALERRSEAARQVLAIVSEDADGYVEAESEPVEALAQRARALAAAERALALALSAEQRCRASERECRRSASDAADNATAAAGDALEAVHASEPCERLHSALFRRVSSAARYTMRACCDQVDAALTRNGWPPPQAGPLAGYWTFPDGNEGDSLQHAFVASHALALAVHKLHSAVSDTSKPEDSCAVQRDATPGDSTSDAADTGILPDFHGGAAARAALLAFKRIRSHFSRGSSLFRLDKPEWLIAHSTRVASEHSLPLVHRLEDSVPQLRNAFAYEIAVRTRELIVNDYCPAIAKMEHYDARMYWVHLAEECAGFCTTLKARNCEPFPSPPSGGGPLAALCSNQRLESAWHDAEFGDIARMLDSLSEQEWECEYDPSSLTYTPPACSRQAVNALSDGAQRRCTELEPQDALRYLENVTASGAEDFNSRCSRRAQQAEWRGHSSSETCCKSIASAASASYHLAESLEDLILEPHISSALVQSSKSPSRLEQAAQALRELAESWAPRISHSLTLFGQSLDSGPSIQE